MAARNNSSNKKEKNYRSRYDVNRHCFRRDKTHYIYQEWVDTGNDQGYYIDHVFKEGEDGVTLELLDYLQATDNSEVQDQEDDIRNKEMLAEIMPAYAKNPEEELCAGEEQQSQLIKDFNEKVKPYLSDKQVNFIYERFGACKTLDELAEEIMLEEDKKTISRSAVLRRQIRILTRVKKLMVQE